MIFGAKWPRHQNAAHEDRTWLEIERAVAEAEALRSENEALRSRLETEPQTK